MHKVPLHDIKKGIWYNLSASRILCPVLYVDTINSERYVRYSTTGPETLTLQSYCSLTISAGDEIGKMATHAVCIAERLSWHSNIIYSMYYI